MLYLKLYTLDHFWTKQIFTVCWGEGGASKPAHTGWGQKPGDAPAFLPGYCWSIPSPQPCPPPAPQLEAGSIGSCLGWGGKRPPHCEGSPHTLLQQGGSRPYFPAWQKAGLGSPKLQLLAITIRLLGEGVGEKKPSLAMGDLQQLADWGFSGGRGARLGPHGRRIAFLPQPFDSHR